MVPALPLGTNVATINVMNSKILIITILISFALAILTPSAIMATEPNEPVGRRPGGAGSRPAASAGFLPGCLTELPPRRTDQTSIEEDQAESPSSGLTEEQVEILKGAGLSSATIFGIGASLSGSRADEAAGFDF